MSANPWCRAYRVTEGELRSLERRATTITVSGRDLRTDRELIHQGLQKVFLVSEQVKLTIHQLLAVSMAHAQRYYNNPKDVVGAIYSSSNPWGDQSFPAVMLTGLAGVGKSECLAVLRQLLESRVSPVDLPGHRNLKHVPAWFMSLRTGNSLNSLVRPYIDEQSNAHVQSEKRIPQSKLVALARRVSRRDGVSLAVVDELQFATHSATANAQVTSLLLSLLSLGPRLVYVCNFSLGHRLKARRQEDRQRLLAHPILMEPEAEDSQCFRDLIDEYCKVVPDDFSLRADDVGQLHRYTFGIKRALVALLSLAWFMAKHTRGLSARVGIDDVRSAYLSRDFGMYRDDVELLWRELHGDRDVRRDLVNPFISEQPKDKARVLVAYRAIEEYQRQIAQAHVDDLMTPAQRAALAELQLSSQTAKPAKAKVVSLTKKKVNSKESMFDALDRL